MRYINQLFTPDVGEPLSNRDALAMYRPWLERLAMPDAERQKLIEYVAFQLVGDRVRFLTHPLSEYTTFARRAAAFDNGANQALDRLAAQILPALTPHGEPFDAILTTTATGNIMPGLSFRMAKRLGSLVRPDTLMIDLANVGCTGGIQLLNLARGMAPHYRRLLLVAVELPTTLLDTQSTAVDRWQGNCTFGDGAAALWVTDQPDLGPYALAVEELHARQFAADGLDLIRWDYGNYYAFALRDYTTFDGEVRKYVQETLTDLRTLWHGEPHWAVHPAGLALLLRLARPLGLPPAALQPSTAHYRTHSNMSSAGILHILNDVTASTTVGAGINLLTMGAGFTVIYGRVRRIR